MIVDTIYLYRHALDIDEMVDVALATSRKRLAYSASMVGALTGFMVYAITTPLPPDGTRLAISMAGALVLALITYLSFRSTFRKHYRKPGQQALISDRTIVLSDDGIKVDYMSGISTFLPWRTLRKVTWGKALLLLYMTDSQFLMIPRRVIDANTESQMRAALEKAEHANAIGEGRLPTT